MFFTFLRDETLGFFYQTQEFPINFVLPLTSWLQHLLAHSGHWLQNFLSIALIMSDIKTALDKNIVFGSSRALLFSIR